MIRCEKGHQYSDVIHKACPACARGAPPVRGTPEIFGKPEEKKHYHRKGDLDPAAAQAERQVRSGNETKCYELLLDAYPAGMTTLEMEGRNGLSDRHSSFSSCVTQLIKKGFVADTGERRDGCRVVKAALK